MIGTDCPSCSAPLGAKNECGRCGWSAKPVTMIGEPYRRRCARCQSTEALLLTDEGSLCRGCWRACSHVEHGSREACASCAEKIAQLIPQFRAHGQRFLETRITTDRTKGGVAL